VKKGRAKLGHWTLGILLNVWGTTVMFIANSWLTYMMSPPRDITPTTDPTTIKLWHAIANATWMPINVHRVIANVVFGGANRGRIRELPVPSRTHRRGAGALRLDGLRRELHRDVGAHRAAVRGLLAGTRDLPVRPVDGDHHDGGFMSWLWVIQAFLIAVLFLTGNYYLWIGMGRIPGRGAVPALHQVTC